jgi:hypothetical protein
MWLPSVVYALVSFGLTVSRHYAEPSPAQRVTTSVFGHLLAGFCSFGHSGLPMWVQQPLAFRSTGSLMRASRHFPRPETLSSRRSLESRHSFPVVALGVRPASWRSPVPPRW